MSKPSSKTQLNDREVQDLSQKLLDHFAAGGTLKNIAGITDDDLEAIYAMAYNLVSARKFDKAEQLFRFLCMYDHTEKRWWNGLGITLQNAGKHEEAVNAYGMATLLDVEDPRPQAQAGYCLAALERWKEAKAALEGAIMMCAKKPEYDEISIQANGLLEKILAKAS